MRRLILAQQKNIEIPETPEIIVDSNKIFYTTTDNNIITPYSSTAFNATISNNSFDNTLNMFVIEFDNVLTEIGSNAFRSREMLSSMFMPDTVTTIGERAFYYCPNITEIKTGNGLTTLGNSVFSTCTSLRKITLSDKLTSIGQYAFYGLTALEELYCPCTTVPTGKYGMFSDINENCKIYVPSSSVEFYKSAKYWSDVSDNIIGM